MPPNDFKIGLLLFVITGILIFLIILIIFITYVYQSKQFKFLQNVEQLQIIHKNEILTMRVETQEETFKHVSREIHDNIGQKLTLAKLYSIQALESKELRKVENVTNLISETIGDLKELSKLFNADIILCEGLLKAIEYEIDLIKKSGDYKIFLCVNGDSSFIDKDIELVLFRISQEALNNILKHSGANEIRIELNYLAHYLQLVIHDNGKGLQDIKLNSTENIGGTGILNMKARAERMKGIFQIESKEKSGTTVNVKIPIAYETN